MSMVSAVVHDGVAGSGVAVAMVSHSGMVRGGVCTAVGNER